MMSEFISIDLLTLDSTRALAKKIKQVIIPDFVVALNGDLGSGKTTLVRGVLMELGVQGTIKSPTYNLVEHYKISDLDIYHFDLYRLSSIDEWFDLGFDEYFMHNSICFIEWASKAIELLPVIDLVIDLNVINEIHCCKIVSSSVKGKKCLQTLIQSGVNIYS